MAAERKSFPLRINRELYAALERWAADELRSVNAQIEFLLTDAARRAGRAKPAPDAEQGSRDPSAPGYPAARPGGGMQTHRP